MIDCRFLTISSSVIEYEICVIFIYFICAIMYACLYQICEGYPLMDVHSPSLYRFYSKSSISPLHGVGTSFMGGGLFFGYDVSALCCVLCNLIRRIVATIIITITMTIINTAGQSFRRSLLAILRARFTYTTRISRIALTTELDQVSIIVEMEKQIVSYLYDAKTLKFIEIRLFIEWKRELRCSFHE